MVKYANSIGPSTREYLLRGRLSTVDLLIKVTCFGKELNDIFMIKRRLTQYS